MTAGRPTVMTDEVIRKLEAAFMVGATDGEASCNAGIGISTLYDYCVANPNFSDRKETLKNQSGMKAKIIVSKSLDEENLTTAHKVIDRKEGSKIDVTTKGKAFSNNFTIIPVSNKKSSDG